MTLPDPTPDRPYIPPLTTEMACRYLEAIGVNLPDDAIETGLVSVSVELLAQMHLEASFLRSTIQSQLPT